MAWQARQDHHIIIRMLPSHEWVNLEQCQNFRLPDISRRFPRRRRQWAISLAGANRSALFHFLRPYTSRYASVRIRLDTSYLLHRYSQHDMPAINHHVNGVNGNGNDRKSPTSLIPTLVKVDPHTPGNQQPNIHTRWHPDIP